MERDESHSSAAGKGTRLFPLTGVIPKSMAPIAGKSNPLMMRTALNAIDSYSEDSVLIGNNMDTDIIMGIESGLETVLVHSVVTRREDVERYSYGPTRIVGSVAEILP